MGYGRMTINLGIIVLIISIAGIGWYIFFYIKEKKILERIQNMITYAKEGKIYRCNISEEKVSAVENNLKRLMEEFLDMEEKRNAQKNMLEALISQISHQTLTPISNLKIYTELLDEESKGFSEIIEVILDQTNKLEFLIQSLVKISRLESGVISVHPTINDLDDLLESIYCEYRKKAELKKIHFRVERTKGTACFDLKWTNEAIGNIVDNAIKYTEQGGDVEVNVIKYPLFVRINICDNGIGISEKDINNIFFRFFRGSTVSNESGIGLGLYIAKEIIQAQKGYIKVNSKGTRGTMFSIFLPGERDK